MKSMSLEAWASVAIALLLLVGLFLPGGREQYGNFHDAARGFAPSFGEDARTPR